MFSAAPDPWLRRALRGLRQGRVHPLRWALFVFCAGETLALALLARTLADVVAGSQAGFHWGHAAMALGFALAATATVRAWPAWWRGLRWRCTAVLHAPDGKGPLRIRLQGPGDARHEAVVRQCWQAGGAAVVRLVPGAPGMPGAIFLPWQAGSPEMSRRLQRAARVALRVQPDMPAGERFC
ncbi:conserved hypothetical protein [Cupriavidus necator]|uniref:Uncharacterized protein n=1 Tax=Cupriavidus necator TaxID=106590 RepID=A0A1K0JFP2_CUPNE|nr:conserved hypothetical protein [Cupriavidus necator]